MGGRTSRPDPFAGVVPFHQAHASEKLLEVSLVPDDLDLHTRWAVGRCGLHVTSYVAPYEFEQSQNVRRRCQIRCLIRRLNRIQTPAIVQLKGGFRQGQRTSVVPGVGDHHDSTTRTPELGLCWLVGFSAAPLIS